MKLIVKSILLVSLLVVIVGATLACSASSAGSINPSTPGLAVTPPSPVFKVDNLAVNPSEINAGTQTLVTANVINTGNTEEAYKENIRIDSTETQSLPTFLGSDTVNIAAGATQLVTVPVIIKNPGKYKITWGGSSQTLLVNPQEASNPGNLQSAPPSTAPDFAAVDVVTGKKISLKQYFGAPILLNFVNYGCDPNVNEIVSAQLMAVKQLKDQGQDFTPVSVFCGCCSPEVLKKFAKENNFNWPWVLDSDYSIARKYSSNLKRFGYPTLVFINSEGNITDTAGYIDTTALKEKLNNIGTSVQVY
jgi:hypothetical protein